MSFDVLRQVAEHNRRARDDEQDRVAALGEVTPNCPSHPLVASWGIPLDSRRGPRRRR